MRDKLDLVLSTRADTDQLRTGAGDFEEPKLRRHSGAPRLPPLHPPACPDGQSVHSSSCHHHPVLQPSDLMPGVAHDATFPPTLLSHSPHPLPRSMESYADEFPLLPALGLYAAEIRGDGKYRRLPPGPRATRTRPPDG
jgi:hypothetical protein